MQNLNSHPRAADAAYRIRTAYHEAAHSVLAVEFGHIVESVSIIPDGGFAGTFYMRSVAPSENSDTSTLIEWVLKYCCVWQAGIVAEHKQFGDWNEAGAEDDDQEYRKFVVETAKTVMAADIDAHREGIRNATRYFLDQQIIWRRVEAVKTDLLKFEYLDGPAVEAICCLKS